RLVVRSLLVAVRRGLARGVDRGHPPGRAQGAVAPRALRGVRPGKRRERGRRLLPLVGRGRAVHRAGRHRVAALSIAVRNALRIVGYAGTVLLLFGVLSFALT